MTLNIQIAPGSKDPIYLQIERQISLLIAKKKLLAGDRLPSVRNLANQLILNPGTVSRAYSNLQKIGLIAPVTGAGTFVVDISRKDLDKSGITFLEENIDNTITDALNLGLTKSEIVEIFNTRLKNFSLDTNSNGADSK